MKVSKKLILVLILSVFLISTVAATTHAVSVPKTDKQIESKEKVAKVKVTWNANGGKIGSKKTLVTSVKKGAKLNKLAATPKRSSYAFQGWYTKKSGGKKISKNTKVSKKVTFYAHWNKASTNTNKNANSKLLGTHSNFQNTFHFSKDGKFTYVYQYDSVLSFTEGKYKESNGKIYLTNLVYEPETTWEKRYKDTVLEYKFGKDTDGEYLLIPNAFNANKLYYDISYGTYLYQHSPLK